MAISDNIIAIRSKLHSLRHSLNSLDWSESDVLIAEINNWRDIINQRCNSNALEQCTKGIETRDPIKSLVYLTKVENVIRMSRNDRPFGVGDRVSITRSDRGLFNGLLEATICDRTQSESGIWSYTAVDDAGSLHTISHTGNADKIYQFRR